MDRRETGNIGEANAIACLTRQGWNVAVPLTEDNFYDFIVEREGALRTVQVKATTYERPKENKDGYMVELRNNSWNSTEGMSRKKMDEKPFDFLFVWTPENEYLIPAESVGGSRGITVREGGKYEEYRIGSA